MTDTTNSAPDQPAAATPVATATVAPPPAAPVMDTATAALTEASATTATPAPAALPTPTSAPTSAPAKPRTRPRRRRPALRGTLLLVLAFIVVGITPLALAARVFHRSLVDGVPWLSALLAPVGLASTATPAYAGDLALPRAVWVAQATAVRAEPASGATVANLEPGFPVTLVLHAATGSGVWDQISWSGPTASTGGTGWVPDAALTAVPGQGPIVGDAGALSPALAATLARVGAGAGLAVYYPATHRLYLTNGDHLYPLGDGARALLATAVLAAPIPPPDQVGPSTVQLADALAGQVAQNNVTYTALAYQMLGGAPGLTRFLNGIGVAGVQPGAADWQGAQGTPRALAQFYALLAGAAPAGTGASALAPDVRSRALARLAPDPVTAAYAGLGQLPPVGAAVTVVLGSAHTSDGWSANASAIVTTGDGMTYIAVLCASGLPSADSGAAAARAVLGQLARIAGA
ncbi:MAG TPA: hypothetical protein VGR57_06990 [Ktedonobacterales bacterium]|nr:hypothetical protein [Ktedonobacterales bacterium]